MKRRSTKADKLDIKKVMADPEIREIAAISVDASSRDFVYRLAEYFTPTDIVLILRAAKTSRVL